MKQGPVRAGVAELEMHPAIGLATEDGAPMATGFLTPLYVKALVLSTGHDHLALVTLDLMGIDRADGLRAAALASERSGIPAHNIVLMCSHTHAAPSMMSTLHVYRQIDNPHWDDAAKQRERDWVDQAIALIADAVAAAKAQLQEASIGTVTTSLPWLTFNRRFHTRDYGVWTHWLRVPANQAYSAEGPIDPQFVLLVVRDVQYQPLCLLWNFSGHNSFNFADLYSGDLAYTVQQSIDEALGSHVPTLYAPGCSGDTNYFDYGGRGLQEHAGLRKATEGVSSAIVALYREACTLPEVMLGSRKAELFFAQRDATRHWWKHDMDIKRPGWVEYGPKEVERFSEEAEAEATYQSDVMVMRLGDTALVALPGEMFVQFALLVKERSPFKRTLVVAYANDYAGYVATREAFIGGSYEVWLTLNARIGREGGYLMVEKAVELLEELYADR
jgi:neutral ceramidase